MTSNLRSAIPLALLLPALSSITLAADVPPLRTKPDLRTPLAAPIANAGAADPFGPTPSPHDSRNVSFVYDVNAIYNLFAQAGQFLQLILAPDEEIVTIQLSDRVRWQLSRVEEGDVAPRIFFKPTQTGLVTTAAIVTAVKSPQGATSERVYDIRLESTPDGGKRYQRVSFTYPQVEERRRAQKRRVDEAIEREDARVRDIELTPTFSVENLNWNYQIRGDAKFRPVAVFDDGHFTYLKMPVGEEWPAVFMGTRGEATMVKTARRGEYLVVQRLADQLLLKLDSAEIQIQRQQKRTSWFGSSR